MAKAKIVEEYISRNSKWKDGLERLRALIKESELDETLKWGQPTYTLNNKNVLALGAFKEHFDIWFFNGALLNDPDNHLINVQEGKTKALRHLRFTSVDDINIKVVKDLVDQAIQNQREGKEVKIDLKREAIIPDMLEQAFSEDEDLRTKFEGLTPGRQRDYAEHIATAKQEDTQKRRLDKIIPMIKRSIGLNDRYQK